MPASPGLNQSTKLLATLADPVRLRVLHLLWQAGEVCVCHMHLALELPQSTVSRHLARLRRDKLVGIRKEGHWIHYRCLLQQEPLAIAVFTSLAVALSTDPTFADDLTRLNNLRSNDCLIPSDKIFA